MIERRNDFRKCKNLNTKVKKSIIIMGIGTMMVMDSSFATLNVHAESDSISVINEEDITINNEVSELESIFNKYAGYYGIDGTLAYEIARRNTNDFTSESFIDSFTIGNTKFYNKNRTFPTIEAGIIAFLRDLSIEPEKFGEDSSIINSDNLSACTGSYEDFTNEICDILNMDSFINLAIMYHETGYFTSNAFINKNNPAGIMTSSGVKRFSSKEQGIIEACLNNYFKYFQNKEMSIEEIANIYCPVGYNDDGSNKYWASSVQTIVNDIQKNKVMIKSR